MSKNNWLSQWISLSDMMTWLMLVFLLLSIFIMAELEKQQKEKNRILIEYNNTKDDILNDLKKAFEEKEEEWQMNISDDLSIKFSNPDVLFFPDSPILRDEFKEILDEFIPWYISIINNEKYLDWIKEVRIEWHAWKCLDSQYEICLNLSQQRANNVLLYIFSNNSYYKLKEENKDKIKFWLTSNWMSNWRNIDSEWHFTYKSKKNLDSQKSRRVEFRIVTNSEDLIKKLETSYLKNK